MSSNSGHPSGGVVRRLARRIGRGDESAFAALFDFTARRLLRYAQTLTRNTDDAEDVLQTSMIRVAESPHRLAMADHPWAYFLRIVRNEALKLIGRRRPVRPLVSENSVSAYDPLLLEREEFREQVAAAIRRLPPEQAEVVTLKFWEEMTFLEISVVLDESPNTAASRYRYAMAKLTRMLQPLADEVCHE